MSRSTYGPQAVIAHMSFCEPQTDIQEDYEILLQALRTCLEKVPEKIRDLVLCGIKYSMSSIRVPLQKRPSPQSRPGSHCSLKDAIPLDTKVVPDIPKTKMKQPSHKPLFPKFQSHSTLFLDEIKSSDITTPGKVDCEGTGNAQRRLSFNTPRKIIRKLDGELSDKGVRAPISETKIQTNPIPCSARRTLSSSRIAQVESKNIACHPFMRRGMSDVTSVLILNDHKQDLNSTIIRGKHAPSKNNGYTFDNFIEKQQSHCSSMDSHEIIKCSSNTNVSPVVETWHCNPQYRSMTNNELKEELARKSKEADDKRLFARMMNYSVRRLKKELEHEEGLGKKGEGFITNNERRNQSRDTFERIMKSNPESAKVINHVANENPGLVAQVMYDLNFEEIVKAVEITGDCKKTTKNCSTNTSSSPNNKGKKKN